MRWQSGRRSENIEDRRGMSMGGVAVGRLIGTIVLLLIAVFFGLDPSVVLQGGDPGITAPAPPAQQRAPAAADDQLRDFVAVVLADTEDVWKDLFAQMNRRYQDPTLVLFTGATQLACGRPRPRWDRSTVRPIESSTSTWGSTEPWTTISAPRATSPRPTSSPTRSATTCSTSSESPDQVQRPLRRG